ncbi:MAG: PAS domain S-box protein [Usitatibacteraceae bacterium]
MSSNLKRVTSAAELRAQAEEIARSRVSAPWPFAAQIPASTADTIHELRVHQIELEMQNDELRRSQLALAASETRYADLYNAAPVGYLTINRLGIVTVANTTAAKLLALHRDALVGQAFTNFIFGDDQDQYYFLKKRLAADRQTESCELRIVKSDASRVWVHLVGSAAVDHDGVPEIRLVMDDISERKHAVDALRKNYAFSNAILDSLPATIAVIDRVGKITAVNESWRKLAVENGVVPGEPAAGTSVGSNYLSVCLADSGPESALAQSAAHGIHAVLRGQLPSYSQQYPCSSAGVERWFFMQVTPLNTPEGGAVIAHTEVTALKQAELAIREGELRLRSVIGTAMEAVVGMDEQGRITDWNAVAESLFGWTEQEALGRPLVDTILPERYRQQQIDGLAHFVATGEAPVLHQRIETTALRRNGDEFPIGLGISSIEIGGASRFTAFILDLSDRKRNESARETLQAQLRESQKMEAIGTLAGGIAHDFNHIIAPILGNAELARQDAFGNPLVVESLDEIRKAGTRARDLVQQILSFSRRQPTDRKLLSLESVVRESARLLRATLPKRVTLEVHCEADVPHVIGDMTQLEQVIINLCTNALHAMPTGPGRIDIRLDAVELDAALSATSPAVRDMQAKHPGRAARLSISDTGHGMSKATLDRVFEPFFTTKAVDEGTGLGLSVVHGIVQTHEGAITVQSEPGEGSTFTIYLPIAGTAAEAR